MLTSIAENVRSINVVEDELAFLNDQRKNFKWRIKQAKRISRERKANLLLARKLRKLETALFGE